MPEAPPATLSAEPVETAIAVEPQTSIPNRPSRLQLALQKTAFVSIVSFIFFAAFIAGMWMRNWTFQACGPMRWTSDRNNAFDWGMRVNLDERKVLTESPVGTWSEFWAGYRSVYDTEWNTPTSSAINPLDYTPLRLLTAGLWARWLVSVRPSATRPEWGDVWPLLDMNNIATLLASAGAFALVRLWVIRRGKSTLRASIYGVIAALLIWLNPAAIVDSHGWPQWDTWSMPFLIWATFCASVNCWFFAAVLIVTGAMFKGQILLIAPVFLLWAFFSGWFAPMVRFVVGVMTATGILTIIWLLQTHQAWWWSATVLTSAALCTAALLTWNRRRNVALVLAACSFILFWPITVKPLRDPRTFALLAAMWVITALPLARLRWPALIRWRGIWIACLLCVALWGGAYYFDGSMSWFRVGFVFPSNHNQVMSFAASSLPQIMEAQWDWTLRDIVITTPFPRLGFDDGITYQWTMRLIYIAFLIFCGIVAAIQSRRGSARLLLAVIAPSVLFYAILPQMQERYLIWGALFSACGIAVSLDMLMLHLVVTFVAFVDILRKICYIEPSYAPRLYFSLGVVDRGTMPELGWIVLMVGLMYVYLASKLDRRDLSGRVIILR